MVFSSLAVLANSRRIGRFPALPQEAPS